MMWLRFSPPRITTHLKSTEQINEEYEWLKPLSIKKYNKQIKYISVDK